mgnify:CR=1 FL=1
MIKSKKKIGLIVLAVLLAIFIGFTLFIGSQVFNGFTNMVSREETLIGEQSYEQKFEDFAKGKEVHYINFPSSKYKHNIPALLVKQDGNKNIAVLVHGMGGTGKSLTHIMDMFLNLGYDVLAIDQRNSGNNQAPYNTFGVLESYDILDAVNIAKSEINDDGKIVLWGESYGGASSAIAAGRDDQNIDYLILESPLADSNEFLNEELDKIEKDQGIPTSYMRFAGNIYTKLKLHFSFDDIDANKFIKNVEKPILITNSNEDTVTPPHMGESLYKAISHNNKEIFTAKGYKHADFPRKESDEYKNIVANFLNEYK